MPAYNSYIVPNEVIDSISQTEVESTTNEKRIKEIFKRNDIITDLQNSTTTLTFQSTQPEEQAIFPKRLISTTHSLQYRKILIIQLLKEAVPLLNQFVEFGEDSPKTLATQVKIKALLNSLWEYVYPEDTSLAFFLNTLLKIFDLSYWRNFQRREVLSIRDLLIDFLTTENVPSHEQVINIIPPAIKILPSLKNNEQ